MIEHYPNGSSSRAWLAAALALESAEDFEADSVHGVALREGPAPSVPSAVAAASGASGDPRRSRPDFEVSPQNRGAIEYWSRL